MNPPLRFRRFAPVVLVRAALFLTGSLLGYLPIYAQGNVLPVVPDPPAIAPPVSVRPLPFVTSPDHEGERRRRPFQVSATIDGHTEIPSVDLRHRALPVLRLPGDPRFGDTLTWTGFWLEFRFHPSKVGTRVKAKWTDGPTSFFDGALPAAEMLGTIGPTGVWRVAVNFDPADQAAQLVVNCEGIETRLVLRRWPVRRR